MQFWFLLQNYVTSPPNKLLPSPTPAIMNFGPPPSKDFSKILTPLSQELDDGGGVHAMGDLAKSHG